MHQTILAFLLIALATHQVAAQTGVSFRTTDSDLQRLYDAAEAKAAANILQLTPTRKALVEGGGYPNVWIETQPMGGEMYAKRNIEVALNNHLLFMLGQRPDGRLPGMVVSGDVIRQRGWDKSPPEGYVWLPELGIAADYEMFQGYCFPEPAWRMYFWIGKDRGYLRRLYDALEQHDAYLWRTRDSNGDGLLETWCVWDTGEDHSNRLTTRWAPNRWPFEQPPGTEGLPDPQNPDHYPRYWVYQFRDKLPAPTLDEVMVPFASMDIMAYSYEGRATLAKIARELGNGREEFWQQQAEEVRQRLTKGLWDPARHACFDRDRTGRRLPELVHNNLRCMWHGIFTQEMADAFIKHHLLNPEEFWTPVPLVSIARNEPLYENAKVNNWSGQPQGLTFQHAIRALENYGHYAEVTLIGRKLLPVLVRNGCTFPQQLDAVTGEPSGPKPDGYGPMTLAALEYISRMYGIHPDVASEQVWWSAADGAEFTATQRWGDRVWTLVGSQDRFTASLNGRECFSCTRGVRVVTDLDGNVCDIVGIEPGPQIVALKIAGVRGDLTVKPNEVWRANTAAPKRLRATPFEVPHPGPGRKP
ncbi:MAG: MGH1-like glycoside hydrolase domain-containing protein [Planctomycetota bacterium]